jgi:putative tricarboxylic transport membrane protein
MHDLKSGLFLLGLSLLVIWDSLRVDLGTLKHPGPGFLAFCAGLILSGLSLILIHRGWRLREPARPHSVRVILALVTLFLYSLLFDVLGFMVTTFLFVGFLFRLGQPRPWWIQLGMSIATTFLVYLVFSVFLKVPFPSSFLGI